MIRYKAGSSNASPHTEAGSQGEASAREIQAATERDRPILSVICCHILTAETPTAVTVQVRSAHSFNCLGWEGAWLEQVVAACEPLSPSTQHMKLYPARL